MALTLNGGQINAAAGSNQPLKETLDAINLILLQHGTALGLGTLAKVDASTPKTSAPPAQSTLSATGANGNISVSIALPQQATGAPQNSSKSVIYQEVSTSTVANFSTVLQTYPLTTTTSMNIAAPGQTLYIRLRSTTDQKTFNASQVIGPISAGLQTSAATQPNVSLNQTNYATVDSIAAGGAATVRIYGSGGVGSSWTSILGNSSKVLPSGTIMNVSYGSNGFVAWDGTQYQFKAGLSQVFPDGWVPVGKVSVLASGAGLVYPVVHLVLGAGGAVIAWNVVSGGSGLTANVALGIVTSTGSGATPGAQTISGGVLQSIAPGNPGALYGGGDTVNVSGGIAAGAGGGGGPNGLNNGRLYGGTT